MKNKSVLILLLIFAVLLSGCGKTNSDSGTTSAGTAIDSTQNQNTQSDEETDESSHVTSSIDTSELFSDRDYEIEYDESTSTLIQLEGSTAVCDSNSVRISESTVTITEKGTYILSGTLNDGMIIVDTEKSDKTQIVLNGADIHSQTSAPIYVLQSDKVFVTTAAGTTNTLSNGGAFENVDENNIDAVIFSKEDLTLNGAGTLVITSPAGHGIVSKDSLTITSGTYDINCASHALAGKDDVCIAGGDFTIVSGKDGIHAENADDSAAGFVCVLDGTYNISAEGDGISASAYLQIEGGSFGIVSGGGSVNAAKKTSDSWGNFMGGGGHPGGPMNGPTNGPTNGHMNGSTNGPMNGPTNEPDPTTESSADSSSMKGIKADSDLIISGGTFYINSADDALHSNGSAVINGGVFEIAAGDDAFHAEETLTITMGTVNITESYEGLEALHVEIYGGDITLVASDDGLNAAGGTDSSGFTGGRDGMFGPGMPSFSNGSIAIYGGTVNVTASGDGLDANGTIDIFDGNITVCGPNQGDTATLDYDTRGTISGGTFIGTGASNMAQTFSDSEQGVIAVGVGNQSAGTQIMIEDGDGNVMIQYTPQLAFSVVIISCPEIISGETYMVSVGTISGEATAN